MKINFHFVQILNCTLPVVHHGVLRHESFVIEAHLSISAENWLNWLITRKQGRVSWWEISCIQLRFLGHFW